MVGDLKTRELMLPRVGDVKKGVGDSLGWCPEEGDLCLLELVL
jgi:hypothetical protein